jgi:penicillin V acylase-like amidase (Ntn superfamily)
MHFKNNVKLFFLSLSLLSTHIEACTLVFWNTNGVSPVVGRTMDLYQDDKPRITVYPRGLERRGGAGPYPLTWTSKYGSVVVTAFHSENTSEGLNEVGLSASLLYLEGTAYEARNLSKPELSIGLWVQYLLDNYRTVSEALDAASNFQVVPAQIGERPWPTHLSIQDKTGDMAIIEYIHGQIKIYHGPQYRVFTNEPSYDEQLDNLNRYKSFDGTLSLPGDVDSLSRFVRASSYLKTLPQPADEIQAATLLMGVMRTVMVPQGAEDFSANHTTDAWPTRWVTIKDLKHQIFYMHVVSQPHIIWIDLHTLRFKKDNPILILDPENAHLDGDIQKDLRPLSINK